jgi:hypothetical protein
VSFEARGTKWTCTVAADTAFESARQAWRFFQNPFWRGPKPALDTVFEVSPINGEIRKTYYVRARRALDIAPTASV